MHPSTYPPIHFSTNPLILPSTYQPTHPSPNLPFHPSISHRLAVPLHKSSSLSYTSCDPNAFQMPHQCTVSSPLNCTLAKDYTMCLVPSYNSMPCCAFETQAVSNERGTQDILPYETDMVATVKQGLRKVVGHWGFTIHMGTMCKLSRDNKLCLSSLPVVSYGRCFSCMASFRTFCIEHFIFILASLMTLQGSRTAWLLCINIGIRILKTAVSLRGRLQPGRQILW